MKYKDTLRLYKNAVENIQAPEELVEKIMNPTETKRKQPKAKLISALAACLAVVLLGMVVLPGLSGGGNSFTLKASAAEVGGSELVTVGTMQPLGGYSAVSSHGKYTDVTEGVSLPFALRCDGKNIKKIRYTVEGAVFEFPKNSEGIYNKTEAEERLKSVISDLDENKQYSGYTVDFDKQPKLEDADKITERQSFPVQIVALINSTDEGVSERTEYLLHNVLTGHREDEVLDEKWEKEIMDAFVFVYDEMLQKLRVKVDVFYQDGSTDSEILRFGVQGFNRMTGFEFGVKAER